METKKRHGCVTIWLVLMIILNAVTAATYFFFTDALEDQLGTLGSTTVMVMGAVALLNVIFAIMLLKWKKWAFWGFLLTSLVGFGFNLSQGLGIGQSAFGLLGILVLYGVLQIKAGGKTAWEELE